MRYGFCTGFATDPLFSIDLALVREIIEAGYDYVELPLMGIAAMEGSAFEKFKNEMCEMGIQTEHACNLFPSSIKTIGDQVNPAQIKQYLNLAFSRARRLGISSVVFGSGGSRMAPENMATDQAHDQLCHVLQTSILPLAHDFDIQILIEPLNRKECNVINTVSEGARIVRDVADSHLGLMADLYHVELNQEPVTSLEEHLSMIDHIHLCGQNRAIPKSYTSFMETCLDTIRESNYVTSLSLECIAPENVDDFKLANILLKSPKIGAGTC